MKHFMIKYQFKSGTTDAWHQEIGRFIKAINDGLRHGHGRQLMQIEPLLDDLVGIAGIDGAIGGAVPHR